MTTPSDKRVRVSAGPRQGGFALIVCLLMLLVMSLLSVGVYRGANLQERIAGNTREKQRALEAAQGALQYAEWWIKSGSSGGLTPVSCAGKFAVDDPALMKVCASPLDTPEKLPWPAYGEYTPSWMTVSNLGGLTTKNDINYYAPPAVHIYYMGAAAGGGALYQISAVGYAGSASTAAVIQSTYIVATSNTTALDAP